MILDNTNVYSDSQAITATAASTNIIDVGAAGTAFGAAAAVARDIGKASEIPLVPVGYGGVQQPHLAQGLVPDRRFDGLRHGEQRLRERTYSWPS
jgi:hypothetical protein